MSQFERWAEDSIELDHSKPFMFSHIRACYAELDKLQACFATCKVDAEAFRQQAVAIALQRDALKAELDKLRKVVDAARDAVRTQQEFLDALDDHHGHPDHPERVKAWENKEAALAALADLDKGE